MTRHEKFLSGSNPIKMSEFEKNLVRKEVEEREMATRNYVKGIQGRDGGSWNHDQTDDYKFYP